MYARLRFEAARASTPVYASHGGADGMVHVAWGRATAEKLKAKGLDLSFKEHSEMDHELGEEQARPWLGCLGGGNLAPRHLFTGRGGGHQTVDPRILFSHQHQSSIVSKAFRDVARQCFGF